MTTACPSATSEEGTAPPTATATGIALCGALALASAMGIGRFAFTPLMPLMLHEGTIDLAFASGLASANYFGYLVGALLCMMAPRLWPSAAIVKVGLVATAVLTAGMALPSPAAWVFLRFASGVASAVVMVFVSEWCLARLAQRGKPSLGAVIYTGPGIGIAVSGFAATGMLALHWSAATNWLMFGALAVLLGLVVWPILSDPAPIVGPAAGAVGVKPAKTGPLVEMLIFALAYGLAGFGYIVTATFLPVIARQALPGSAWLDLFWPILGLATVAGCLLAMRVPKRIDPRLMLVGCYLMQATGVVLALFIPTVVGFVVGSLLTGLPFTAISFFSMQEVRRLRPHRAARYIGLLTALYGIGQIAGPPFVTLVLAQSRDQAHGFATALGVASGALILGAALYGFMRARWSARA
ncbi:YbfB/YjiJ family MFS transporter [Beijerinckia sp. L45]|uniref:YbfB/YjiJ family MFS transporter n=1 Tax=Beijerinckia sp. L45 TaxID=1641855 RepID=UPI00131AE1B5|nr:YbfB/YjiJ family MFS transporter [Beijerinckia sp. L45]